MESQQWKILLVEDDEDDYLLTRDLLSEVKGSRQFELEWVTSYEEALHLLCERRHAAYLVDYRLGMRDGLELVREAAGRGCRAPIIMMTGQGSYDLDLEAMKAGATDYLVKGEVTPQLLERTIRYAIERKAAEEALRKAHDELETRVQERTHELVQTNQELQREISERQQAQEALSESEARFRKLAETTSTAIFIVQDSYIRYANPAAKIITGYDPKELMKQEFWTLAHPNYQKILRQYGLANQWAEQVPARYELKMVTKTGQERWVDISSGGMEYDGQPALVITAFDITERDRAERALKKAKEELEARVAERTHELRHANEQLGNSNDQLAQANLQIGNSYQQLRTILQALPVGVWITNAQGRIIQKNEMADRIWGGYAPLAEDIDGYVEYRGWWADSGEPLTTHDWPLARAILDGATTVGQVVDIRRFDGSSGTLLNSAAPIHDMEGCLLGAVWVSQDITEQRQLERQAKLAAVQAQQRAEEMNTAFSAMTDAVVIYNAVGEPQQANPAAEALFGFHPLGLNADECQLRLNIRPHDGAPLPRAELPVRRALQGTFVRGERFSLTNAHGQTLTANVSASPLYLNNRLSGALVVWHDITQLEQTLAQLEAERAKLDTIIAHAPEAIVVADSEAHVLFANRIAEQIYQRPVPYGQDYSSHAEMQLCHLDGTPYDPRQLPLTRAALDGETSSNEEILIVWPDGQQRHLLVSSAPLTDRFGVINGAISIFQDITERRKAEEEIQRDAAQIEVQRHLIQHRELERLDIAQDLHDGPLQELIGLSYGLNSILQNASVAAAAKPAGPDAKPTGPDAKPTGPDAPDLLVEQIQELQDHLRNQIHELRVFCSELRPPTLIPFGLEKAIRSHAEAFQERHPELQIQLELVADGQHLPEKVRVALFRIYQETLHNVVRHANASQVWVRFQMAPDQAALEIEDNGCGFEVPHNWLEVARQGHLGLVGAQERATAIGGVLNIISAPQKGARVRVQVSLDS